ncbi:MAG: hypothetical protein ONA90_06075, partial [candidate division KSB1 bacterium]|nr:hypothetical protein [candidate division KSB1 bacterium]
TLIYQVIKTGTSGGVATLTATVKGRDKNSNTRLTASRSATVFVETTALVRISKTSFPETVNRLTGTDIALVNTGQNFPLEVTVENTGGLETVDTVWVTLTVTQNGATIFTQQAKTRRRIGTQSDTAKALFSVTAPLSSDSLGVKFTARIDSAKTLASYARIGPALDDTAVVRVEQPARLQLSVATNDADNSLTAGQAFKVRALVSNAGRAQPDNSGRLQIQVPEGYTLNDEAQKSFLVGVVQEWEVEAPAQNSMDDTLIVKMTQRPLDKNSGQVADTVNTQATVVVNTFVTGLSIDSVFVQSPNGAKDRIISTDQILTIAAHIRASDNLSTKTATLRPPAGFGYVLRSDSTKAVANGVVSWEVQAPADEHLAPVKFPLEVSAFDGPTKLIQRDSLTIERAERRAIVQLQPGLSDPPGARAGILSTGQALTISATLRNTGRATTRGNARVRLDLGSTGLRTTEPLEKEVTIPSGSYERTVLWQATAPETVVTATALTFAITQAPLDVNTDAAVTTTNDPALFTVSTIRPGSISARALRITSPAGAVDDTVSTGQDFIISTTADWTRAVNVSARLLLPSGFLTDDEVKNFSGHGETARDVPVFWRVRAPGSARARAGLRVRWEATDAHNNQLLLTDSSRALLVEVVDRAELELRAFISNPASAMRGVLSPGQPFEIRAVISNAGKAAVYDTAKVRLDLSMAPGYTLVDPQEPLTKAAVGNSFAWWVRARQTVSEQNDIIRVEFVVRPRDENTNEPAFSADRRSEFPARVEGRRLLVKALPRGTRAPTIQGQQGLPLLRLELRNPATAGASNLVVKKLRFVLRDRNEQPVPSNAALTTVRIVDDLQRERLRGWLEVTSPDNSIEVVLSDSVVVSTAKAEAITILGDVATNTTMANFYLAFDHGQNFTVVDQDSGSSVVIEDEIGRTGEDFQINSEMIVLVNTIAGGTLGNYPNPLRPGKTRTDGTFFLYHLPEDSDGVLKIYSLLGELVWETSFTANSPAGRAGFHNDDLFWDGFNGQGKKVLNGVYVAILITKNGKLTTKVAVVK